MSEINRNFPWCDENSDDSFIGILHEEYKWSDTEYFKLDKEIYELSVQYKESESIPRELAWRTLRIFSILMQYIGCHFDPNDGFKIKELTNEQIYHRRERAQLVFEGFFKGEMPDQKFFEYSSGTNE